MPPSIHPVDLIEALRQKHLTPAIVFLTSRRACDEALTSREREVMAWVVSGLSNKQVGGALGISEITVKAHRGQVMRKMQADSLPGLVTMASRLGIHAAPRPRHQSWIGR